jgi:hypothetical protein
MLFSQNARQPRMITVDPWIHMSLLRIGGEDFRLLLLLPEFWSFPRSSLSVGCDLVQLACFMPEFWCKKKLETHARLQHSISFK